jgi:predicted kinase
MKKQKTPVVYMICGFIGAGKTTFAKKLEAKTEAVRITKDEWLIKLLGHDPRVEGFGEYDAKMCELSNDVAFQFVEHGVDVIIDNGFGVREQREEMKKRIESVGAEAVLYYVKCPMKVMKERVINRSSNLTEDSFEIDEGLFDSYVKYWQPPGEDEDYILAE